MSADPKNKLTLPRGTKVPDHIAIIPDGNRRWARARGLMTFEGHKKGFERVVEVARAARKLGVHTVTIWGFSTENWDRTVSEISYLMKLYERLIDSYLKEAKTEDVRIVHLGRKDRIPKSLLAKIIKAEKETLNNKKHVINVAIDYGGQDDIIRAVKHMVEDRVDANLIDKELFERYLDTKEQPYPYADLLIRTSGEQRTSGFLMWQAEYAEMYWDPDHLPDFTPDKLKEAILDYSRRRRRFGGNDQLQHFRFKPEVLASFEVNWWRLSKIPQGTKFVDYAMKHLKEQFGLSSKLAASGATLMLEGFFEGRRSKWQKARARFREFYKLIKDEVKLAFEPSIVASLQVKLLQKKSVSEIEDASKDFLAEVYRISEFQASKAAHLRALATVERSLAENSVSGEEEHWIKAEDYLQKYYRALKERVA